MITNNRFNKFFKPYAKTVDQVDKTSAFWRLSDAIIMEVIKKEIIPFCTKNTIILDAGGGTARWAINIAKHISGKVIVFDRSKDMLKKAEKNLINSDQASKITLIQGDMTNMHTFSNAEVDYIVSIYSPLSFIYEQKEAINELYRILKKRGRILIMSHSYYNALFSKITNYSASIAELIKLEKNHRVVWAPHVPELIAHSKETLEELLRNSGFHPITTFGIPVFVQPGKEDFDPNNKQISNISKYLENEDVFRKVFSLEMRHNNNPTVCNRGMNMFALAEK